MNSGVFYYICWFNTDFMKIISDSTGNKSSLKYTEKAGHAPGELTYIGDKEKQQLEIKLIQYNAETLTEYSSYSFPEILKRLDRNMINWIDVEGINNTELIQEIANYFDFHLLMTEDILNTEHLPKSEEYENHHFLLVFATYFSCIFTNYFTQKIKLQANFFIFP